MAAKEAKTEQNILDKAELVVGEIDGGAHLVTELVQTGQTIQPDAPKPEAAQLPCKTAIGKLSGGHFAVGRMYEDTNNKEKHNSSQEVDEDKENEEVGETMAGMRSSTFNNADLAIGSITGGSHAITELVESGQKIQLDAPKPDAVKLPKKTVIGKMSGGNFLVNRMYKQTNVQQQQNSSKEADTSNMVTLLNDPQEMDLT